MRKNKLSIGNTTGKHFLLAVDYSSKLNEFHEASEGRKQGVPLRGAGRGGTGREASDPFSCPRLYTENTEG